MAIYWPDEFKLELWLMSIDHSIYVWNHLPKQGVGFSPEELWTGTQSDHVSTNQLYIWGLPGYVIDPQLQNGKKILRWSRKFRQGLLGLSPIYSTMAVIILNVDMGNISS